MKCLKFRGDRTDELRSGQILGPDATGLYHEVTAVRFDPPFTIADTRKWAPAGQRVRYFGGRDDPPPPTYDEESDTIEENPNDQPGNTSRLHRPLSNRQQRRRQR